MSTTYTDVGTYALDRHDRLWRAWSWDHGTLLWQQMGHADKWPTSDLEERRGPLRRVTLTEGAR